MHVNINPYTIFFFKTSLYLNQDQQSESRNVAGKSWFGWKCLLSALCHMQTFPTHCKHPIYWTSVSYYRYQLSKPCCWWSPSSSNGSNNLVWCVNLCFIANEMVLGIMNVISFLLFPHISSEEFDILRIEQYMLFLLLLLQLLGC